MKHDDKAWEALSKAGSHYVAKLPAEGFAPALLAATGTEAGVPWFWDGNENHLWSFPGASYSQDGLQGKLLAEDGETVLAFISDASEDVVPDAPPWQVVLSIEAMRSEAATEAWKDWAAENRGYIAKAAAGK